MDCAQWRLAQYMPCPGETAHCTPSHVFLTFHAWTNQWLFLDNPKIWFLIDGKRVGPVLSKSTATNVSTSACSADSGLCALEETVTVLVIPDHFKVLASSKNVEIQINGFNIELTDKNFGALKQVAETTYLAMPDPLKIQSGIGFPLLADITLTRS